MRSELAALDREFVLDTKVVDVEGWPVRLEKPRNSDDLISEADYAKDERLPYWADLWPSAESLARHLVRTGVDDERGRAAVGDALPTALELGCGIGLVTIAAMRAGYRVTGTDYYADALRFTARNALANVGVEPATRHVDWRALPDDLGLFDLVLAADVLYERPYAPLVAAAIARTLAPGGVALVADQGRVGLEAFLAATVEHGLAHRTLLTERPTVGPPGDPTAPGPTVTLYELRWAP
ncbi:MAG: class I SAM-dependent methyltransferase [Gemmatimonadaceae bacterium]